MEPCLPSIQGATRASDSRAQDLQLLSRLRERARRVGESWWGAGHRLSTKANIQILKFQLK
jgi:hypothetical protein